MIEPEKRANGHARSYFVGTFLPGIVFCDLRRLVFLVAEIVILVLLNRTNEILVLPYVSSFRPVDPLDFPPERAQ